MHIFNTELVLDPKKCNCMQSDVTSASFCCSFGDKKAECNYSVPKTNTLFHPFMCSLRIRLLKSLSYFQTLFLLSMKVIMLSRQVSLQIYVTSFLSISCFSNSEHWSQKTSLNGNIHSIHKMSMLQA